jgi:hypothetical protein
MGADVLAKPGAFRATTSLLANMLQVSPAYIAVARRMSPAKRAAILSGSDRTSFVPLVNSTPTFLLPAPKAVNGAGDAELEKLVRKVGVGRVLDAAIAVERAG